jgi:STIP1 family protein 1
LHKLAVCLREACETALKEKLVRDSSEVEGFVDIPATSHLEQLKALRRMLREAAEADMPTEVSTLVPLFNFIHLFILI